MSNGDGSATAPREDGGPAPTGGAPATPDPHVAASPGGLFGPRRPRRERPHPYADEASPPVELAMNAKRVTLGWFGLATALVVLGLWLASMLSPAVLYGIEPPNAGVGLQLYGDCTKDVQGFSNRFTECAPQLWEFWTEVILFAGLALLAFGYVNRAWAKRLTMAGWLLFGFYWALLAQDLLILESQDYVNFAFALVGTFFFTYLAYHQWLNKVRGVENHTVRFLNISTFIAATSYFVIDKVIVVREWLIYTVSDHTTAMLGWFGQGTKDGLVYVRSGHDTEGLTTYFYPEFQCDAKHGTEAVREWCSTNGVDVPTQAWPYPHDWLGNLLHFQPDGDLVIKPVSIILACTALQSMMLFVGLYMGTRADLKKRLVASAIVAVVVYLLNLLRNTGIIWFYGKNVMSFWVIHDAIGKGGSLIAMIAIAFLTFRWFPEFLKELIGVLDLPHRDGPVERGLRIGRRRPTASQAAAATGPPLSEGKP